MQEQACFRAEGWRRSEAASLRPWKSLASVHLPIPLLFPRVSRKLEAATCTLAQRCSPRALTMQPWDHPCLPQVRSAPLFTLG